MQIKNTFRSNIQGRDGNPNTIAIRRVAELEERVPSPNKSLQKISRYTVYLSHNYVLCQTSF